LCYDNRMVHVLGNLTTLIVGVALLAFGSGPVRGFAVVHVLGILTSMFSSVVGVRALANFWYGRRKKLPGISIGTVWRPGPPLRASHAPQGAALADRQSRISGAPD